MQGVGLCSGMLTWVPGYAAAGIIALLSPLYLAVLPILAPVSHLSRSHTCTLSPLRISAVQIGVCLLTDWLHIHHLKLHEEHAG